MAVNFQLVFDSPDAIYFPGQTVSGKVTLNCSKPIPCRAIDISMKGYSYVKWTEQKYKHSVNYISKEAYYNKIQLLWGDQTTISELPEGEHVFQFSLALPPYAPSSYESLYGHVRHDCTVQIHTGKFWKFDSKWTLLFTVIKMLDLNKDLNVLKSISEENSKTLGCLCCTSGKISISINIARSGFVPGERILINAECNNNSRKKITKTRATLFRVTVCKVKKKAKTIKEKIVSVKRGEILPGGFDAWSGVPLTIPATTSSFLNNCNNIEVNYILEFTAHPTNPSTTLRLKIPVTIGNIPLAQTFEDFNSNSINLLPSAPNFSSTQNDVSVEDYPDIPAPSFDRLTGKKWEPYNIYYKSKDIQSQYSYNNPAF